MTYFLTFEDAMELHADQIARYGGSPGVRDESLLRSALAQPEAAFGDELLHPTIEAQAAAYLFHLAKNHPFVDGNKRAAAACCLGFLVLNGTQINSDLDNFIEGTESTKLEAVVVSVATGKMSKEELTSFIRENLKPV